MRDKAWGRRSRMVLVGLLLLALVPLMVFTDPSGRAAGWIGKLPQPGNWGLIALCVLGVVIGRIGFRRSRSDREGE